MVFGENGTYVLARRIYMYPAAVLTEWEPSLEGPLGAAIEPH